MSNGSCDVCGDVITNPLCAEGILAQAIAWANDKDGKLAEKLMTYTPLFSNQFRVTDCVICHRYMSICSVCVSLELKHAIPERWHEDYDDTFGLRWYTI